jgi:hypothetical protein
VRPERSETHVPPTQACPQFTCCMSTVSNSSLFTNATPSSSTCVDQTCPSVPGQTAVLGVRARGGGDRPICGFTGASFFQSHAPHTSSTPVNLPLLLKLTSKVDSEVRSVRRSDRRAPPYRNRNYKLLLRCCTLACTPLARRWTSTVRRRPYDGCQSRFAALLRCLPATQPIILRLW